MVIFGTVMRNSALIEKIGSVLRELMPAAKVILYGSQARGEVREGSDVDLLILSRESVSQDSEHEVISRLYDLELESGTIISSLILPQAVWEKNEGKFSFSVNVARDGIVL